MTIIVIAGNYRQYQQWLNNHQKTPREAKYVNSEEQVFGLSDNLEIVMAGEYWTNPVMSSDYFLALLQARAN